MNRRDDRGPQRRGSRPGERVEKPAKPRPGRAQGRTTKPRGKRSEEIACRHFPACVGCPEMGRSYSRQLASKHQALKEALGAWPELSGVQVLAPVGSPRATGYRNHAKLVFRQRRNRESGENELILGVYKPGTHSVMPAESCIVHHRRLQPLLRTVREEVEDLGIPIYDERSGRGALRYLLARTSNQTGRSHVTFVSAVEDIEQFDLLVSRLQDRHKELESVFLCFNPDRGNRFLSSDIRQIKGPPALREKFGDLILESRAGAFVQANTEIASRIYATAARWLDAWASEGVIDLYCGIGALGLAAAGRNTRLLGIEESEAAIECARANAKRMRRHGAEFLAAPAEEVVSLAREKGFENPAAVIVNPPRAGLSQEAGEAIVQLAPRRLLYVSCDPTTLARDLAAFAREGWKVPRARAFDMFPQTRHLEALALLERRS